jgi:hypothetical protein
LKKQNEYENEASLESIQFIGGLPFNSVGVYRVRSVDSKSNVWLQKKKLYHPAKLGKII